MGATTFHRIDQVNVTLEIPVTIYGKEFPLTIEAQVQFCDDPNDMKASDGAYIAKCAFGTAHFRFHDLPAEMRAAIEAAAISRAYDIVNDELLSLI